MIACSLVSLLVATSSSFAEGVTTASATIGHGRHGRCPTIVDVDDFASPEDLRELLAEFNSFGLRSPASDQHEASIDWLARELDKVHGMRIEWDEYEIDRWQPTTEAPGSAPGRDLATAGGLAVVSGGSEQEVPVIGAVPFTLPTSEDGMSGPLTYIPADQPITEGNAAGRVVIRELPHVAIPYTALRSLGHYVTDDVPTEGAFDRPYARALDSVLIDAGKAHAAGVVMVWDAPTDQLRGYWDPHTGTRFHVPGVYVGIDQLAALRELAAAGATGQVVVRAEWEVARTRNLIATLRGRSRERIVVNANTDSVSWVQENGVIAAVALARYLGHLPKRCRNRDVQFAMTTNHLGFTTDGVFRYGAQLDEDYDEGTVAFVMALEHLGAREILPAGPDNRLEFTGAGELFVWSAPDESPVLVEASVDAVQRRGLDRTGVLRGIGAPSADRVPSICSQGGLGTVFHGLLVPTIAGISGPWSLWAPAFGEEAIDFDRMRDQTLAFGDIALQLDDVRRREIAGTYLTARARRAAGTPTCDLTPPPAVAPLE